MNSNFEWMKKHKIDINEIAIEDLEKAQEQYLFNKIRKKELHKKYMLAGETEQIDIKRSATWLKKGNNTPQAEAFYCYLQDRNIFFGNNKGRCNHCKQAERSVDHLATRCGKMLHYDYLHRHDEVLKCLHLLLCNRYGMKNSKKLRNHKVAKYLENVSVIIKVDIPIATDIKVKANKPDIIVFDKINNEIIIVEIGITSIENLKTVELEKLRKYDLLAKELAQIHKSTVKIIPYVLTWDGLVTTCHQHYKKMLEVEDRTEAYIQSLVLKKTFESISVDFRRAGSLGYSAYKQNIEDAAARILEKIDRSEALMTEA